MICFRLFHTVDSKKKIVLPGEKISRQLVDININVVKNVERRFRRRKLFADVVDDLLDGVDGDAAVDDGGQVAEAVHLELVRISTRRNRRHPEFETR